MAKFAIGDTVRVIANGSTYRTVGEVGEVADAWDDDNYDVLFPAKDREGDLSLVFLGCDLELVAGTSVILRATDLPGVEPTEDPDTVQAGEYRIFRGARHYDLAYARAIIAGHRYFDANPTPPDPAEELARVMAGDLAISEDIARMLPLARRVLATHDVTPK